MLNSATVEDFMRRFIPHDNGDKAVENLFLSYIYLNLSKGLTLNNLSTKIIRKIKDYLPSTNDLGLAILSNVIVDYANMNDSSVYAEKIQSCFKNFENECSGKSDDSILKAELAACAKLADLLVVYYEDSLLHKKQNL